MPGSIEHLQAHLIVDNCFLVMLTDCFCDRFASRYSQNQLVIEAEKWINEIVSIVKRFALDGKLHCTPCVAGEYFPHAGKLARRPGIQRGHLDHVQGYVRAQLHQVSTDNDKAKRLRLLPAANKTLVGPTGLSDNDLSLIQLGLEMTQTGSPVFILSNDQSLLDFATWVRIQKQHFSAPIVPGFMQAWRCLTYLEQIHRSCNITTDLMQELIDYSLSDHYSRVDLAGTDKGKSIYSQLLQVNRSFSQSIAIKLQTKGAAQ
jgi:hypothetical protein